MSIYLTPKYNLPVQLVLNPFGAPRGKVGFCIYAAGTVARTTWTALGGKIAWYSSSKIS